MAQVCFPTCTRLVIAVLTFSFYRLDTSGSVTKSRQLPPPTSPPAAPGTLPAKRPLYCLIPNIPMTLGAPVRSAPRLRLPHPNESGSMGGNGLADARQLPTNTCSTDLSEDIYPYCSRWPDTLTACRALAVHQGHLREEMVRWGDSGDRPEQASLATFVAQLPLRGRVDGTTCCKGRELSLASQQDLIMPLGTTVAPQPRHPTSTSTPTSLTFHCRSTQPPRP
jgi:hypothetical protein